MKDDRSAIFKASVLFAAIGQTDQITLVVIWLFSMTESVVVQSFVPYQAAAWKETVTAAFDHPEGRGIDGDVAVPVALPVPSLIAD